MAADEGAESRFRRSLQKLDLPEWYKRSAGSSEKVLSGSREKGLSGSSPSGRPRWSEWRQRSTSASSLGPVSGGDWSANSSFKRYSASGRQSKESLSPMSPSSVSGGMPWYGGTSGQRPHSAFNCYSYHAGYSSASVSRCSSSRSTSPSAMVGGPSSLLRSPYRQPYLGWRSSEKLAREGTPSAPGSAYHYRSPAERLSKGPGYYAFKFGMYTQTTAQGGNYVRQMVQEIERANQQQQKPQSGSHSGRSQVTVNVIGPSPIDLQPEVVEQVEDMVRQIDELIVQNGADEEKQPAEVVTEDLTGSSEAIQRCVWMESSFVGTKPASGSNIENAEEDSAVTSIDLPLVSGFDNEGNSSSSQNNDYAATSCLSKIELAETSGTDFDVSGFTNVDKVSGSRKLEFSDISGAADNDDFRISDISGSRKTDPYESSGSTKNGEPHISGFTNVSDTSSGFLDGFGMKGGVTGLVTSADVHVASGFLDDLPDPVFDEAPEEMNGDVRLKDVINAEDFRLDDDVSKITIINPSSSTNEQAQPTVQSSYERFSPVLELSERKLSLSNVEMDDVLHSLLALPSTSSNRNSPCSRFLHSEGALPVWPTVVQAQLQVPSAPPLEPEEEETEGEEEEEEEGSESTCGSSTGSGSPSGCSSVSSVSRTAACTSATTSSSSSTSCSHPSCNRDSSSTATDRPEETSERPETNTTHSHTLSTTQSTDESTLNNEEPLSEGSTFPPPPGASELQQMMCLYEEASSAPSKVTETDEQPLSGQQGRTRRYPRPDHLDSLSLVQCSRGGCEKEMEMREARNLFKTCHNCYTFYCSRECRKEHWAQHRTSCMYGRVRSLCKQALQYSRENEVVLHFLTKIARTGLLTQGPGFVKLLFRNTDTAIRYLREGRPQLEDGPIYVGWRNFLPEEMGDDVYRVVVQLCQNYDPVSKFILVVAVFVTREVPLRTVPHWEREIIAKCAKISLAKNGDEYFNNTLVLSGPSEASCLGLSERESRLACLDNISLRLEEHGVNLKLSYPDVYHRLCSYVDLDEPFTPITIYPKDTHTGNTFMCVIMPNTSHHNHQPTTTTTQ